MEVGLARELTCTLKYAGTKQEHLLTFGFSRRTPGSRYGAFENRLLSVIIDWVLLICYCTMCRTSAIQFGHKCNSPLRRTASAQYALVWEGLSIARHRTLGLPELTERYKAHWETLR